MKKSILLLSACLMVGLAQAQQANQSVLYSRTPADFIKKTQRALPSRPMAGAKSTASATERWYNYGGAHLYRAWDINTSGLDNYYTSFPYTWWDTSSRDIYSGTPPLDFNTTVGMGMITMPWWGGDAQVPSFNDTMYNGELAITPTTAYTVDSLEVVGIYYRNKISTQAGYCATCVDTLRLSWTYGNGTAGDITTGSWSGPIGPVPTGGTLTRLDVAFDSVDNLINAANHVDILLNAASVTDTDAAYRGGSLGYIGLNHWRVAIPGVPVPANNLFAVSVAFKSGNPAAPHMPPGTPNFGDTVWTGNTGNPVRWSMFRPEVAYHSIAGTSSSTTPATADWPLNPYTPSNLNQGFFKPEGAATWGGKYINMWAFHGGSSSSTPANSQYPAVGFHAKCTGTGCPVVGASSLGTSQVVTDLSKVAVVPNPAHDQVAILFAQASGETATVSLTNMLGQEVATQSVTNGKAVFNTSALPSGLYIYSVKANGQSATGRMVVAH